MGSNKGAVQQQQTQRDRDYTPKQKMFLELLVQNDFQDGKQCAKQAGYVGNYWKLIASLKEDITAIAQAVLLDATPKAAGTLVQGLEQPMPASMLTAAKEVLDRSGVTKPEVHQHDVQVSGGLFILPAKQEVVLPGEAYEVHDD